MTDVLLNGSAAHDAPPPELSHDAPAPHEATDMAQRTAPALPEPLPRAQRTRGWKTTVLRELARSRPRASPAELKRLFDSIYPDDPAPMSSVALAHKTPDKPSYGVEGGAKPARARRKPPAREIAPQAPTSAAETHAPDGVLTPSEPDPAEPDAEPTLAELRRVWQWLRANDVSAGGVAELVRALAPLFGLGIEPARVAAAVGMVAEMQEAGQ